jgi:[FeFe] hydrogenase H-cluster maturation GTPase HydF
LGADEQTSLADGILPPGGLALLVLPIDSGAPKGRLILPQMQTMRAILDMGASFIGTQTRSLGACLDALGQKPDIVITDSQHFGKVAEILPADMALTSFSILFARYKGDLAVLARGAEALGTLLPGDKVLIAEACSHHAQQDDIGTVKIPRMLHEKCGEDIQIEKFSGRDYPDDLAQYRVIIHCGACMLTAREMRARMRKAAEAGVAITNYGITIAWYHGILERALKPFA